MGIEEYRNGFEKGLEKRNQTLAQKLIDLSFGTLIRVLTLDMLPEEQNDFVKGFRAGENGEEFNPSDCDDD